MKLTASKTIQAKLLVKTSVNKFSFIFYTVKFFKKLPNSSNIQCFLFEVSEIKCICRYKGLLDETFNLIVSESF